MKLWQIIAAASIGIIVVVIMMIRDFDISALSQVSFSWQFIAGVVVAFMGYVFQNLFMAERTRLLVDGELNFWKSLRVFILCEFTSAVTPSAVGGSGLAFIYLNQEGVNMGKSTFTMFAALFADELFLGLTSLALYLFVPANTLFGIPGDVNSSIHYIFLFSTVIVCAWTLTLFVLIFHHPEYFGKVFKRVCTLRWLRRFYGKARRYGNDLTVASAVARRHNFFYWLKIMGTTTMAWLSRFGIVVAILWAFDAHGNYLIGLARQWVIWMIAIISPTPGGSGVAELMFRNYYSDFISNTSVVILAAMIWRFIFYYTYLLLGTVMIATKLKK
ncbi:MAG: lysylphosphatidylglycerol synthase transmembrane domain-containing protein [Prevotellaceae bacterium]|nr:lysylphosphatidylglycerol synthase transmembrane domain-containing protein [Prevotella sp.]MDD6552735.1 lysylphosphatidylglycerol synthase transmembrane domain-containing protein [Prevotellaceae bacterium]